MLSLPFCCLVTFIAILLFFLSYRLDERAYRATSAETPVCVWRAGPLEVQARARAGCETYVRD